MQLAFQILGLASRLLFALGLGCLLLAGFLGWRTLSFGGGTAQVTGEVVSYREMPDGDTVRYKPRIRFEARGGEIITVEGQLATTRKRFAIGARVPMTYKVADPLQSRVALFADNWLGASIALVVGLVGVAGGWLVRRQVRAELAKHGA